MAAFYIKSYGCKVNQYDAQVLSDAFTQAGWQRTDDPLKAALCIVAGCGVTSSGEAKAWRNAAKLARLENNPEVILGGCSVKTARNNRQPHGCKTIENLKDIPKLYNLPTPAGISGFEGHTRAFVKIQDGCTAGCSYCIIHKIRGPLWSKPAEAVIEEINHLCGEGYSEIVLSGIHIGFYGRETPGGVSLDDLVEQLLDNTPVKRLRISSIEVMEVTDRLVEIISGENRIAPHLHMPLQSGSDKILGAMNRPYSAAQYLERVEYFRKHVVNPAVSSDVIIAFPGETGGDFSETLTTMRRAGFSRTHVFPFSPRPGTPAALMAGKPPADVVKMRKRAALECAEMLAVEYRKKLIGLKERVVVLKRLDENLYRGMCGRFVDATFVSHESLVPGDMVNIEISGVENNSISAHRPE